MTFGLYLVLRESPLYSSSLITQPDVSRNAVRFTVEFSFLQCARIACNASDVIVTAILSVRPSVRPSVCPTRSDVLSRGMKIRSCGLHCQVAQYRGTYLTSVSVVSGQVKFIRIYAGDHPQRGR